jgi:hypothetical protein
MGGTGVPPPPAPLDTKNPQPLIPTPEQVRQFGLQPDFSKPQEFAGQQYPTFRSQRPDEASPWQLYDAPGPMVQDPVTKKMVPGPSIKRQVNPITGETRDLVEQGQTREAYAAPKGDAAAPGWLDWLKQQTAGK